MRSSISNSEPAHPAQPTGARGPHLQRATIVLVASVAVVLLGAELLSRYAFPRISQIESRIRHDEHQTMSIRDLAPGSPPSVLLVGNSLLLRGLDYPKIRTEMAPDAQVFRFTIENTEYLDWFYGLRHLFVSGVHPSVVVVCLSISQTVSSKTLGDYSARHLFGASDLLPVAHASGMDATRTSGLILAHWSAFYSSRATIRNFILNRTAPGYAAALHAIADNIKETLPPDGELISTASSRMAALQQLCRQYGVDLVILVPPSLGRVNDLLTPAASLAHVELDDPVPGGSLAPDFFRPDRTHLNEKGAAVFTDAVTRCLRARLEKRNDVGALQHR
jgi:hypothetical protein